MSQTIRGVVQRTFSKQFENGTAYSFTLKGQDGFFSTGYRPAVEQGKAYEFEYTTDPKGRKSVNLSTLRPWEAGDAVQAPPVRSFARSGGFKKDDGKDEYWKNKEARDIQNDRLRELGATRNTAIALVDMMLRNGAVKLPAKEANKEEVIYALVEHYVDVLMKGQKDKEPAKEQSKEETAAATEGDSEWN